jgi:hypothetical protein
MRGAGGTVEAVSGLAQHPAAQGRRRGVQRVTSCPGSIGGPRRIRGGEGAYLCRCPGSGPCGDGEREALRLLMTGRDNAIQSAKTARTALAAILVTAPAPLRERLRPLPRERRAKECAALTCPPGADRQTPVLRQTLIRLGQRIATLTGIATELEEQVTAIVEEMAPGLAAAEPRARPTRKSAAASSATSPATSTAPSARLDKHRSVMKAGHRRYNTVTHGHSLAQLRLN